MSDLRKPFDEAVVNMSITTSPYYKDYVFYMHLIAQCKVVFTKDLPAAAGVSFKNDHHILYINPSEILGIDKHGRPTHGFCDKMPLAHRIGLLKHEMLHIALGHLIRVEDRDFTSYNYASDCALNQEIDKNHLPEWVIMPHNLPAKIPASKIKLRQTAEYYYDILNFKKVQDTGSGLLDDHSVWEQVEGDGELQQELTKNMVEKAAGEAHKGRGNLPSNYAEMIENLTINREVNWERELRRIVGNKKANKKKTLLRKNRRLPKANYIKGVVKDRQFELGVVSDVSGSVGTEALYTLWGTIIDICKTFAADVNLVQVDTDPKPPTKLTSKTKALERKANGGTSLSPAILTFKEHNIRFDALVITTDGYLCESDLEPFYELRKPIIWLIEPEGSVMEGMNRGLMRAIKLKNFTGSKR